MPKTAPIYAAHNEKMIHHLEACTLNGLSNLIFRLYRRSRSETARAVLLDAFYEARRLWRSSDNTSTR